MLSGFRVLDLTDYKGFLCGKILADLGADVIKIEPPGGDPSRSIGPFYREIPEVENSLLWHAYNANKRGITLNVGTSDGREIFKNLTKIADFIIESFPPGHIESLGLGYSVLSQVNPRIIMTSITSFGQTGPYRDFKSCDLVDFAMSGLMYLTGDPDRAPVQISFPHACLHASAQAAVATLAACYYREKTGKGQQVDVSIHQSLPATTLHAIPYWLMSQVILRRAGQCRVGWGSVLIRQTWQCKDGFVSFIVGGGGLRAKGNRALVRWMDSEGMSTDFLKCTDWESLDMAKVTSETVESIQEPLARFFKTHTKAELYEEGMKRRVDIYPVTTCKDIVENPQLKARGFWVKLQHPELDTSVTYPGAFLKASENPMKMRYRAPHIGEHNCSVYLNELGLSMPALHVLKQSGVI